MTSTASMASMVRIYNSKENNEIISSPKGLIKAWTKGVPIENQAIQQLQNIASLPFVYKHVAVMPDVHYGKGATVGSVIATKGAIIPAAVGVDIGCGMKAVRTSLKASDLPDNLQNLRFEIEKAVPHGRTDNGGANDRGAWGKLPTQHEVKVKAHLDKLKPLVQKYPNLKRAYEKAHLHAGTLGGGNHFIELCIDENQDVWIMLHSGSRGIGNRIGTEFIEAAKADMARWFINLPDTDLSYIPEGSDLFNDYVDALDWAQDFAAMNRDIMFESVLEAITGVIPKQFTCDCQAINCHHNYVSKERHFGESVLLTRKGAVSAKQGELGIIPGSMGAKSFIVEGKGCRESFMSCSHGAGRIMSRNEAKATITLEEHAEATKGVECKKDESVLDETPKAYKDIDAVMKAQEDLVEIKHTLKQVLCVKG